MKFQTKSSYTREDAIRYLKDGEYATGAGKAGEVPKLRDVAQAEGLLGPTRREEANKLFERPQRQFSAEEIKARLEFSEAECRRYYVAASTGAADSDLARLKASDLGKYSRLQTAARSWGIIPESASVIDHRHPARTRKVADDDGKFPLSQELAEKYALPVGYRITADDLGKLHEIYDEVQKAKGVVA
jgi:hypothetical protein